MDTALLCRYLWKLLSKRSNFLLICLIAPVAVFAQTPTTTVLTADINPSCFGSGINLTATITPNLATGTIEFFDGASSLGITPMSGGSASLPIASLPAGSHTLTAVYSGDVTYNTSTSNALNQLVNAGTPATPGSISGNATQCPSLIEQIYSVVPVADANTYNWSVPAGWTITNGAGTETISVTTGLAGQNGNITVTASNACGTSSSSILPVTVGNAAPATPGTITGTATTCAGTTGLTYSITAVANATSYTWNVPAGWVITAGAGTVSITVTAGPAGSSGDVSVTASNTCGTSAAQLKAITVNSKPPTPGTITGPTPVCPSTAGLVYSIAAVPTATAYTWAFPAGWTITSGTGTNSVTVTSGTVAGNITVAATNTCGSSATPVVININPVNATDNTGFTDGTVKVSDLVTVGTTAPEKRGYLKFPLSAIPAGSTVTASVLRLTNNVSSSSGAVSYVRALGTNDPVSATAAALFAAAGAGANYNANTWGATGQISLTLLAAANTDISASISTPGYIAMGLARSSANMYNFYGYSGGANAPVLAVTYASVRSMPVTLNPAIPVTPGTITGGATACPSSTGNVYSITAVTNATTYTWTVPTGWNITAGAGTTSITVTAGAFGQNGNITVTAGNSCGTSAAQTRAVTVSAIPTVSATPATQTRCSGVAIGTITITNPNAVAGTTFTWTRTNTTNLTGIAASGTTATITGTLTDIATTQQTTTFTINAIANGCTSTTPATVNVIVDPKPTANAGVDQSTCAATPATIGGTPTASGGTPGYTYLWTAGVSNTTIANPTAPPGSYTVTVTDSKGCQAADGVVVSVSTGTKTWVGDGLTGGSGPDNNFNNPLNWSPAGVPGSCNDVIISVDVVDIFGVLGGNLSINVNQDVVVKSLTINVGGVVAFSSGGTFALNVGVNSLSILNNTSLTTNASSFFATPVRSYIAVSTNGIVTYGGDLNTATANGCTNYPLYANTNNNGKFYINGNANLIGIGNDLGNKPAQVIFNGTGVQNIIHASGTQAIYLGVTSTDIGETNSPTVQLIGSGAGGFINMGTLNINNTSTLDLGSAQSLNRNTAGGAINMAAGSFLKLARGSGGVAGSNFPSNYSTYNFMPTSTVDYNGAVAQTVFSTPSYGNLTLSNASFKTAGGAINVQKNVTITGSTIFSAGSNTITLGGNWTNYGTTGFNEQTSTVHFNAATAQAINTTGGEVFYSLIKSGAGTTTMLSDVAVQGGGTSSFTQSAGTFDAGTFSFNSASGIFNMSGGLLRLARTGATLLPEFAITTYNLTGGTIELYGAGAQVLRGARAYRNLTFSTSGLKTVSSAITSITGTILTQNSVTLDVSNNTMGGAGTNLTMTGTSLYKTAGTNTKPDAAGTYTLGVGTTVEFTNTAATTEDVRLAPNYYNLVVSGSSVANASFVTGIKFQAGGTFTIKNGGLFKLANSTGFSGGAATAVANSNSPAIILEDGSTVEYYGGLAGTNPQVITNVIPYYHLGFTGTSVKTAPAGTLTVKGNLYNNNSGYAHNNGTVLLNGITAQNYNSTGTILTYYNLTASNAVNVNINGDLGIANLMSLGTNGKLNLVTGNVALKSTATNTASVDKINVANSISYTGAGRFIVERFIPTGTSHSKSWQLLATPAFGGQSVNAGWQEGNAPLVVGATGLGTTISSERPGAVARGYDFYTVPGPSIKTYNPALDNWLGIDDGVTPTNLVQLNNKKGYMILVRGDRSVQTSTAPANPTTFRTTGKLYAPGTDAAPSSSVLANKFESVGNPFASAIDFTNVITSSTGIDSKYYVWDPLLPGGAGFGLGAYQLLSSSNLWKPIPGGTTNYPTGVAYTKIQSGQAVLVYSTPGGTVNFTENNKISGNQMVYRFQDNLERQFLRASLYGPTGILADGNVVAFDHAFTNDFNADDAIKLNNATENFAIKNYDRSLALDARKPVSRTDTVFYTFNNFRTQAYTLAIAPEHMDNVGATAYFVDKFNRSSTPVSLSDSTFIHFDITSDPASSAADRFYIVFKQLAPVPVTITSISANRVNDGTAAIQWKTAGELNIDHYELEKSADGRHFESIQSVPAAVNNGTAYTYNKTDNSPFDGNSFYRVKVIGQANAIQYSNVASLAALNQQQGISIYPNPVKEKTIQVYFDKQEAGNYQVQLHNTSGQVVYRGTVHVSGIHDVKPVDVGKGITRGNYQLNIISFAGKKYTASLFIE